MCDRVRVRMLPVPVTRTLALGMLLPPKNLVGLECMAHEVAIWLGKFPINSVV